MARKRRSESTTNNDGPAIGPRARLAVTVITPVIVLVLARLGPTLIDLSVVPQASRWSGTVGVFALGIMPYISASYLVELVAAIVPRWAPLRHGGPEGRATLARVTRLLTLALCVFQGFGITKVLASLSSQHALGPISEPMIMLTLTAGTCLLCFVADLAGTYGLTGGVALMVATSGLLGDAVDAIAREGRDLDGAPFDLQKLAVLALVCAGAVAITAYTLRPRAPTRPAPPSELPYRAMPGSSEGAQQRIPAPASGVAPTHLAMSLASVPTTLVGLGLPLRDVMTALYNPNVFRVMSILLLAGLCILCAWGFNQPEKIAALRGAGGASAAIEAEARAELRPAIARSFLFCMVVFGLTQLALTLKATVLSPATLVLATALALDVIAERRARLATPDLVPVWPEHRPYALAAARAALDAAGIPMHARNEHVRRLLQFFGPFAPIELMVPRADATRARRLLTRALSPRTEDDRARAHEEASPLPDARRRPAAQHELRQLAALSLLAVGAVLGLGLVPRSPPPAPIERGPALALEILALDDENDPLEKAPEPLPAGVSLRLENVPLGPLRTEPRHHARAVPVDGESLDQTRARFEAWLKQLAVPAGDHLAVARVSEYDDEKSRWEVVAWRSYLLAGRAEITGPNVVNAAAHADDDGTGARSARVSVQLDAEGGARFAALTRANIKRRLAIVVGGIVEMAPVIQNEIPGGSIEISLGPGDPDEQLAAAERLARQLH